MSLVATSSTNVNFHQWKDGVVQQVYVPLKHNDGHVKSLSWSKDGSWLVLVPGSGLAEIISVADSGVKLLQNIECVFKPTCATFQNSTKRYVAVGTLCGQVLVYDIKGRSVQKRFTLARSAILQTRYNTKDTHLAVSCANGEILLFSNTTSHLSACYRIPNSSTASAIGFHRTRRNMFAAGSEEGVVATWDINTNAISLKMQAHQAPVTALAYSPIRSDMLVTSGLDRRFTFHDILVKKSILEVDVKSSITAMDFSCCGMYLGLGSHAGGVVLYDTRNLSTPLSAFSAHEGRRINHFLFQKTLSPGDDQQKSTFDVVVTEDKSRQQNESSSEHSLDLLGSPAGIESPQTITGQSISRKPSEDDVDSFLKALGLDNSLSKKSELEESAPGSENTENAKRISSSRRGSVHFYLPSQQKVMQTPSISKAFSSSPKYLPQDLPTYSASPIVSGNVERSDRSSGLDVQVRNSTVPPSVSLEEHAKVLKQVMVMREELKSCRTEIEGKLADIGGELDETQRQMRSQFLHLYLSVCKHFVDMQMALERKDNELMKKLDDLSRRMFD